MEQDGLIEMQITYAGIFTMIFSSAMLKLMWVSPWNKVIGGNGMFHTLVWMFLKRKLENCNRWGVQI